MINKEIESRLFELRDEGYREFQSKLIPTVNAETVIGVFEIQHFFVGTVVRHAVDKHHLDFAVGVFLKCYISKQSVDRLNLVVGDHAK